MNEDDEESSLLQAIENQKKQNEDDEVAALLQAIEKQKQQNRIKALKKQLAELKAEGENLSKTVIRHDGEATPVDLTTEATFGAHSSGHSVQKDQAATLTPQQGLHGDTHSDPYVSALMQQLCGQQMTSAANSRISQLSSPQTTTSLPEPWNDPRVYLSSSSGAGKSPAKCTYYEIVDFVDVSGGVSHDQVVLNTGSSGPELVLKSGPKKPKLEYLSVPQWSLANLAIAKKLVSQENLDMGGVLDYLSYSAKIYQLLLEFTDSSVFRYDREYRKKQAQYGFRWGTDINHLAVVHLKPRGTPSLRKHDNTHGRGPKNCVWTTDMQKVQCHIRLYVCGL